MTTFEQKHGRPKPPPITSREYDTHMEQFGTISVWSSDYTISPPWDVDSWCKECEDLHFQSFSTHAEAVAYAHKLAYERNQR